MSQQERLLTSHNGFNGAMPFQAWILEILRDFPEFSHSFNGAMPFQAWIQVLGISITSDWHSFNGAMPFQAWILHNRQRLW